MIGLIGRRPVPVQAQATLAARSAATRALLASSAAARPAAIFRENDFPNYWGEHKHHFLIAQYYGKCAFCESRTSSSYPGDVEHFRPKAYCQDLGVASSLNDVGGEAPGRKTGVKSGGYWWLAYEWSNYLYCCNRCNSIWKKNQFPIVGRKARHGGALRVERPLLINPFEFDPDGHFDFDANTGQIRGLTPQGVATIQVCGLDRKSLEIDRSLKGKKLLRQLSRYLKALNEENDLAQNHALNAFLEECRSKECYAALARVFVKERIGIDYKNLLLMKRRRII